MVIEAVGEDISEDGGEYGVEDGGKDVLRM